MAFLWYELGNEKVIGGQQNDDPGDVASNIAAKLGVSFLLSFLLA
jgi:hypothetical protein